MNKLYRLILFSFLYSFTFSSTIISGIVLDEKKNPIIYANVYLENTFDGTSTDQDGKFYFETDELNSQNLIISYIGYETFKKELMIEAADSFVIEPIQIVLIEVITKADEVVITAGSFGASDDEKVIVLDPVDIVSVASSRGEISGALEALPGTQPQADKEGVFVRGGDASEAKQIIDGMLVQNPYFSDVPDIPQRGRFEPFDFQGTAFSQGGYSAQYGQALSSIVDLQTWSRFGDFNAHVLGVTPIGFRYGRAYGNDSTYCNLDFNYGNQKLLQDFNNDGILSKFIKNRTSFSKPPAGTGIRASYNKKFTKGIYKFLGRYTDYSLGTSDSDVGTDFDLDNDVLYWLTTYKGSIGNKTDIQLGLSNSENKSDATIGVDLPEPAILDFGISEVDLIAYSRDDLLQFRSVLSRKVFSKSRLKFGVHFFDQSSSFFNYIFKEEVNAESGTSYQSIDFVLSDHALFEEFLETAFTELDLRLFRKFALNAGIRYEKSKLINKTSLSPRFSMAYKISKNSQSSYAYGKYYQTPELGFDQWYRRNNIDFGNLDIESLEFENSEHHILNYEWSNKNKMLRLEIFEKTYRDLITLHSLSCANNVCPNTLSNNGKGYSKGFEMFWRYDQKDNEGVGQDVFMTYSYLDSKRSFKEYLNEIRPSFASEHKVTFSYNNTFYLNKTENKFSASLALTGTSGFPYFNPLTQDQLTSDPYFSLDIGGSYLPDMKGKGFLVLFFNISNPLGYRNSFGYEYKNIDFSYLDEPKEKLPASLRTVFVGCFMFFSIDKD